MSFTGKPSRRLRRKGISLNQHILKDLLFLPVLLLPLNNTNPPEVGSRITALWPRSGWCGGEGRLNSQEWTRFQECMFI